MTEATSTIYPPPRPGLPYLVVTFAEGAVVAQPAETRVEARATAARRNIGVERADREKATGDAEVRGGQRAGAASH